MSNFTVIASLYVSQVVSSTLSLSYQYEARPLWVVSAAGLVGYAIGVAAIAFSPQPRSRVITGYHLGFLVAALVGTSLITSFTSLTIGCVLVGVGASVTQRLIGDAAYGLEPRRARAAIGQVICAGLCSILIIRLTAEAISRSSTWRMLFLLAAAAVVLGGWLSSPVWRKSHAKPELGRLKLSSMRYLPSVVLSAMRQQVAFFCAYSAGWMTLLLQCSPLWRSAAIICGSVAGIAAAFVAGRAIKCAWQVRALRFSAFGMVVSSCIVLPTAYGAVEVGSGLFALCVGMGMLDCGLQVSLVVNQARAQAVVVDQRTRVAALLTICGSLGGALGSGASQWLWSTYGWQASAALAGLSALLGLYFALAEIDKTVQTQTCLEGRHTANLDGSKAMRALAKADAA